ncbi:MAG: tRNA (guanosine(37)-N1)-methyltransferase TrmD [Nitrospinota bacterium]|nr:tRNA (guanosine(37)-N1)-methyltransferase TrmD [Nitrospinota bacterium]
MAIHFDVLTIFPDSFKKVFDQGVIGRAIERGLIELVVWDLRDFSEGSYRKVDDEPFGGGAGMVLKIEPIYKAIQEISKINPDKELWKVLMTPQGRILNQNLAKDLLKKERFLLICGRYEGVDERVREFCVDDEISVGDYILSGGEIPSMIFIDVLSRLVKGVLSNENSLKNESFSGRLLDYPHYTRPAEFNGMKVPDVLLSGNHDEIEKWRKIESFNRTQIRRRDLFEQNKSSKEDLGTD